MFNTTLPSWFEILNCGFLLRLTLSKYIDFMSVNFNHHFTFLHKPNNLVKNESVSFTLS